MGLNDRKVRRCANPPWFASGCTLFPFCVFSPGGPGIQGIAYPRPAGSDRIPRESGPALQVPARVPDSDLISGSVFGQESRKQIPIRLLRATGAAPGAIFAGDSKRGSPRRDPRSGVPGFGACARGLSGRFWGASPAGPGDSRGRNRVPTQIGPGNSLSLPGGCRPCTGEPITPKFGAETRSLSSRRD